MFVKHADCGCNPVFARTDIAGMAAQDPLGRARGNGG
jgi:hypothetical protein